MNRRDVLAGGGLAALGAALTSAIVPAATAQRSRDGVTCRTPARRRSPPQPCQGQAQTRRGRHLDERAARALDGHRVAATAGFDSLYVEMQHSTFTEEQISQICQAALGAGITAMVRVPSIRPEHVGRALDGGALGIIAPEIETVEEVRELVAAARFPPWGKRSAPGAQVFPLRYQSFPTAEAYAAINDATMVVTMLENTAALERVEEIAAVDGLDMLFIGTSDLTNSMGLVGQPDHPRVREAFARHRGLQATRQTCRHRRPRRAAQPDRPIPQDGRPLRLQRHRPRLPARRRLGTGQANPRHFLLKERRRRAARSTFNPRSARSAARAGRCRPRI